MALSRGPTQMRRTSLENFLLNWTDAPIALFSCSRDLFSSISERRMLGVAASVLSCTWDPAALGRLLLHRLDQNKPPYTEAINPASLRAISPWQAQLRLVWRWALCLCTADLRSCVEAEGEMETCAVAVVCGGIPNRYRGSKDHTENPSRSL